MQRQTSADGLAVPVPWATIDRDVAAVGAATTILKGAMHMADQSPVLQRLSDVDLTVVEPDADVRGRTVLDRDGNEIGEVDDLVVDAQERKVRFLEVGSGGILGIGEEKFLMPVDAVAEVRDDAVRVNETGEKVRGAPKYDPDLGRPPEDWEGLYGYYGYTPYWTPGYTYPAYPYYPYPPV